MTQITKADGTRENFKHTKLRRSLQRAGAQKDEISEIVSQIEAEIYDGITTQEIYRHAFSLLQSKERPAAARYSLRRALFDLGPTGFPFEDFLARLFQTEGYNTKTRVSLHGRCAPHELDVVAYNDTHSFVSEAKFHSRPGIKSDLQVVMYSYARLLDLKEKSVCKEDVCGVSELWIVTNTKFTKTAQHYAECTGVNLLSWDYPKKDNLHDRIQRSGLYPITVLTSLSTSQKQALIKRGHIVCSDIHNKPHILRHAHVSTRKTEAVISEARQLCRN